MSDTPRTDGMEPYSAPYTDSAMIHVPATFARQLERELNQAKLDLLAARVEADTWGNCAEMLAKHVQGVSDADCRALDVFAKLKGKDARPAGCEQAKAATKPKCSACGKEMSVVTDEDLKGEPGIVYACGTEGCGSNGLLANESGEVIW